MGSGLTQSQPGHVVSEALPSKLFADKENNGVAAVSHQINVKMGKSGSQLRHANTSDCLAVDHRPSSSLAGAPEHQMMEEKRSEETEAS